MYPVKALDFITSNNKRIMIYEYLDYSLTVKVANNLVVAVSPNDDDIVFLIQDEHGVYDQFTNITSTKPSAGIAELSIKLGKVRKIEEFHKNELINSKSVLSNDHHSVKYHYSHKTTLIPGDY